MKKLVLGLFLIVAQAAISQDKITKSLGEFTQVKVFDQISLRMIAAGENKMEISGSRKNDVEIVNKNGELKVRMKLGKLLQGEDIEVALYYTGNIDNVEASEGSYLSSDQPFKAIAFSVNAKEGSEIKIAVETKKLSVRATSGGIVRIHGTATNQDVVISSGGIVRAKDLKTTQTTVAVNAGGEAEVNASELVEAKTRAGGNITVYGNPSQVNKKNVIGGSIDIVK